MKKLVAASLFLCLAATGCAEPPRSVETMEQFPLAHAVTTAKPALTFKRCVEPKLESYPVMVGFSFDDRTTQVLSRETDAGIDLFQMQDSTLMTLVAIRHSGSGSAVSLYVTPYHFAVDRIKRDYSAFIDACK